MEYYGIVYPHNRIEMSQLQGKSFVAARTIHYTLTYLLR